MEINSAYKINLIGYCSLGQENLLNKFLNEGAQSLSGLDGEYAIIIENDIECYIITSSYGVCQYYYTIYKNRFFHSDTVIGVIQKSRVPWSWNWKALADVTCLQHVLENDTLHSGVTRVPARSILHFKNGNLNISSLSWEELHRPFHSSPFIALDAFDNAVKSYINDKTVLSLSGGFDSRVILSSLLKHGCKPLVVIMGSEGNTDKVISSQICSSLGLDKIIVGFNIEDYLEYGTKITALTNGTKSAMHWHTYIYIKKANLDSDSPFFIGSNGEFARTNYVNYGALARLANMVAPVSLPYFWSKRLELDCIFNKEELKGLHPEFANEFTNKCNGMRVHRLVNLCHHQFFSGLDRFVLEQLVRNFTSNGLRLYAEHVLWRTPFLNRQWVNAIWNLKVDWKLGSNWHRFAIAKNYPRLLNFVHTYSAVQMRQRAPLLYWLPFRKIPAVPYVKYAEWFGSDLVVDFIIENTYMLSELIEKDILKSIVLQHKRDGRRTATVAFLINMIFWHKNLQEVSSRGRQ